MLRFITISLMALVIAGCSIFDKKEAKEKEQVPSVEEMYNDAKDLLDTRKFLSAINKFEEVERTYPYSRWAILAEVMSAYANFQNEEYDAAITVVERFIRLHPGNSNVSYMYYLKALCYYEQIASPNRDQSYTQFALNSLKEVVARFPASDYARDARLKMDLASDYLAAKQLAVGRYYLKRGNYVGAINRFRALVSDHETTVYVPEALHRTVEGYMRLGLRSEAQKYAAVLGHNFPGNPWYGRSYELIEGKKPTQPIEKDEKAKFWKRLLAPIFREKEE